MEAVAVLERCTFGVNQDIWGIVATPMISVAKVQVQVPDVGVGRGVEERSDGEDTARLLAIISTWRYQVRIQQGRDDMS